MVFIYSEKTQKFQESCRICTNVILKGKEGDRLHIGFALQYQTKNKR